MKFLLQANETGMPERASYPMEDKTCFGEFSVFLCFFAYDNPLTKACGLTESYKQCVKS